MSKVIMIQGTMSGVGKSWITAGLCRIFRQDGYSVAPFKSQNMSRNSYLTDEGLEMSRAQAVQAEAAGLAPSVLMNPILLKPVNDTGSQLIVNGKPRGDIKAGEYFACKDVLLPEIMNAYEALSSLHDIIVVEGAGSPAEINLKQNDFVNMGLAKRLGAPVLLVGDINRGGVFAQLVGTLALLDEDERDRVKGLIINKFRGDIELLRPGIAMLEEKAGKPVAGTVPYLPLDIEEEDSLTDGPRQEPVAPLPLARALNANDDLSEYTAYIEEPQPVPPADSSGFYNLAAYAAYKEEQYDKLAALLRENLDMDFIYKILNHFQDEQIHGCQARK